MKKYIILAILALSCLPIFAYEAYIDGIYYYFSGDEAIVTHQGPDHTSFRINYGGGYSDGNSYSGEVVIPEKVTHKNHTYLVTGIGSHAFCGSISLTSVSIPNCVTSIGTEAFRDCINLTYIIYGSGDDIPGHSSDVTYLINGDFEEWLSANEPLGWKSASTVSSATLAKSTDGRNGSFACKVMAPGSTNKRLATQEMTLEAGSYTFSYYAKSTTTSSSQTKGGYVPIKADGNVDAYKYGNFVDLNNSDWTLVTYDFELASTTTVCLFIMNPKNNSYSVSQDILIDDATLTSNSANVKHLSNMDECTLDGYSNLSIIGEYAFAGCKRLSDIIIPNSVTTIGEGSFSGCSRLASITIPKSVTTIGNYAFNSCSGLTSIIVELGNTVYDSRNNCNAVIESASNTLIAGCQNTIIPNSVTHIRDHAFYNCTRLTTIAIPNSVTSIGDNAFYGCYDVRFLVSRASYALIYAWNHFSIDPYEIGTGAVLSRPSLSALSTTQTSIIYTINNIYSELEYEYMGEAAGENTYMIKGLRPDYTLTIPLKVLYANNSFSTSTYITTSSIAPKVVSKRITASSLTVEGSYTEGDAKVVSTTLTIDGRQLTKNEESIHGLNPNTSYTCKYSVVVEYGDGDTYTYNGSNGIKTASLTLTTQQPKVIYVGNVIVSAESNLDDEEKNIGFEWRRTDWTDEFASNSGEAYLYNGIMEGYIRNLYTEKLWKYRPFYESNSGKRYYGQWVGIDPTNTSYFEPTVHTYAAINVTGNRAEVKGYAMRGTDKVTSQGFIYWKNTSSYSLRKKATSIPSDAVSVEVSGNVMTTTLENLDYETTYNFVAFVRTEENETFFGEVQTFNTHIDPDGIEEVMANVEVSEVARYDIQGRKLTHLQKGINIIRYSDGSSKKVFVR